MPVQASSDNHDVKIYDIGMGRSRDQQITQAFEKMIGIVVG